MQMNDMILVSVDDHIIEPSHVFTDYIASKYKDQAPRIETFANGEERWRFDGRLLPMIAQAAVAGRRKEELGAEASKLSELRPSCYDHNARVADMNANGVLSSLCFSSLPGFGGELFLTGKDRDLMLALVQAYNDWHCDEWCGSHPGRFIPNSFVPLWDPQLAVAEIRRMARKGVRAICIPENPSAFGLPSIHRKHWDPIFEACLEHGLTMAVHIGTGGQVRYPSDDSPADWGNTMVNIQVAGSFTDLAMTLAVRRSPDLRIALSEGCLGWVPFLMERADFAYENHRFWTKMDFGDMKPSDIMKRNFLFCFHDDPIGLKLRHEVGVEKISWECDFPHADSTWPNSPEVLWRDVKDFAEDEINKISHENALRFFGFDPFKHIPREQATVGVLRALAKDVDVTPLSMGGAGRHPEVDAELNVVTIGSLRKMHRSASAELDQGGRVGEVT
jgi:predicted TIM-barrel fold metal-dependent hydrolase